MQYMDAEKKKRHQSLKVIFSEAMMVITVIITVIVLALVVSGYWINSDFKVERQGMLQISSQPTGADVSIDGDTAWLQRTNTSKVLPSGEHVIVLNKEGYDSWAKTITIKEGLLYRLHYPRLFLKNRVSKKVLDAKNVTATYISPDHNSMILANNTTKWQYLNLREETLTPVSLDISKVFSSVELKKDTKEGKFTGKIEAANWDVDAAHVLFKVRIDEEGAHEWVLFDVKNPEKSLNLNKEFNADFNAVQILDNSSNNLMAIQNGDLRKVDVPGRLISAVIVEDVISFDHFLDEIIFTAKRAENAEHPYYVGYFKVNSDEITELISAPSRVHAVISKFYDQEYCTVLSGDSVKVYTKEDLAEHSKYKLSFKPKHIKVGHNGEFIIMYDGTKIASLDMEAETIREWQADGKSFHWIDNDMIYSINNNDLIVYDFDGLNRRALAKNVSDRFSAGIVENKWLYYFSDDHLMREWIIEH